MAALSAWWFMGQGIKPATVPGLLLIIVGAIVMVTSGVAEQAMAQQGRQRSTGIPPYPAHTPDPTQSPPALRHPTFPDSAGQDPGGDWARYTGDESPTVTLTAYHGAGAFGTLFLRMARMPRNEEGEPNVDGPAESWADHGRRR
ncbi:hypothetical protein [Streptomyces sp. TLI_185]|uniref:hypothetical protein n=1 Tax=Streptomyces sp. TLI_185 TaxID=2485151 RepID=UPI000F4E2038|nr:hypothetical protein [Streptomyces sp. TLI_185]RPF39025.1 hypothetical protein EDD92_9207 [Streptomyces sp. TLI_185]